jgi:hypothetical protein
VAVSDENLPVVFCPALFDIQQSRKKSFLIKDLEQVWRYGKDIVIDAHGYCMA